MFHPRSNAQLCIAFLLTSGVVQAQRTNEVRLLTGLNIGFSLARIDSSSAPAFSSYPWPGITLDLGTSLTHRNKWGVSIMGTLAMNGFAYKLEDITYDVYHITQRVEGRAWWLFPFSPENGTLLRIGAGYGLGFRSTDELRHDDASFNAVNTAAKGSSSFIAPEIGLSNFPGRHCFDLGIRYVRHVDRGSALTTTLTSNGGATVASATDDYVGLVFRYHIGFKRKPAPPLFMPAIAFEERRTDTLTTLTTRRSTIKLELWDNAEYDGDTISVLLNNKPILVGYALTHKKKRLTIPIRQQHNTLLIVAHNEGRVAPNTASCIIQRGKGREQLLIRTSNTANMTVIIERDPIPSSTK